MTAPRAPLTPIERKLWHFLLDHLATHSYQPSLREIARHFRIPSTRTVHDLMGALETKGYLRKAPGRSRGVVIEGFAGGVGTVPVPLLRRLPNGGFERERVYTFDRALIPVDDAYLIRTNAEDAPRHAVREGDLVLVAPNVRVPDAVPAVARVGAHIVVRSLQRTGARLRLLPPGDGLPDIELGDGDDFEILGPLALVLRVSLPPPGDDAEGEDQPDA